MATNPSAEAAWRSYSRAVTEFYAAPVGADDVERSVRSLSFALREERSHEVLTRSQELRDALTVGFDADDPDVRNLVSLKLIAAASFDLTVSGDLAAAGQQGAVDDLARGAGDDVFAAAEIREVLDAPLDRGVTGLVTLARRTLPNDLQGARAELEKSIGDFATRVPEDAAALVQRAATGVAAVGFVPLEGAAGLGVAELLARLPEGLSAALRHAADLVLEAVRKLRAAFGQEQEAKVREQIETWFKTIQEKRDTVTGLLDKLYETRRVSEETVKLVRSAPEYVEVNQYNLATQGLEQLMGTYRRTKDVLEWAMRALNFAGKALLALMPWGPFALYAGYLATVGIAIYSGGDYLDWHRAEHEWLDHVRGLRTTVAGALR